MQRLLVLTLLLVLIGQAQARPEGIGSVGNDGCVCHGGSDDTTTITLNGLPDIYNSSESYNLILVVESPVEQNNPKIKPQAHSDYVIAEFDDYGHNFDVMIEAKHKELALLRYRDIMKNKEGRNVA